MYQSCHQLLEVNWVSFPSPDSVGPQMMAFSELVNKTPISMVYATTLSIHGVYEVTYKTGGGHTQMFLNCRCRFGGSISSISKVVDQRACKVVAGRGFIWTPPKPLIWTPPGRREGAREGREGGSKRGAFGSGGERGREGVGGGERGARGGQRVRANFNMGGGREGARGGGRGREGGERHN